MEQSSVQAWKGFGRHPRILYWFWAPSILNDEQYVKDLHYIAEKSSYTMVVLSARDGMDFFDRTMIPHFRKATETAHSLGLQIVLQLWPEGFFFRTDIRTDEAVSLVGEAEAVVPKNGKVQLYSSTDAVRAPDVAHWMKSELVSAYAFRKMGDGKYEPGSLQVITPRAVCREEDEGLWADFDLPELAGYTVYMMAAHYYAYPDLFGEAMTRSYRSILTDLQGVGFDSVVLDEFKNISIKPRDILFRDRFAGKACAEKFAAETGYDLTQTMFDMRYAAEGDEAVRISAINRYFDWMRQGPRRFEKIMVELVREFYGPDAFIGMHNTYHNRFTTDEMWETGCNWWELPRRYAQTDKITIMPVQMALVCQCPEAIHYDMFFHREEEAFLQKAVEEARFGGRVHYHAMNDFFWGIDTGSEAFVQKMNTVEKKIALLNWFDGPMPKLDLLIVFGMPALCNWYPDIEARNHYDIHGDLNILERADKLWNAGVRCALAPSDAVDDGRIRASDNGFTYCGHEFTSLLYLYPQYAKETTAAFLETSVQSGKNVRIIGAYDRDYDGAPAAAARRAAFASAALAEDGDPIAAMQLPLHPTEEECRLENGSMVCSSWDSVKTQTPHAFRFRFGKDEYTGQYIGCAAMNCTPAGNMERFVCGGFTELRKNGGLVFSCPSPRDVYWEMYEGILHEL